MFLAVLSAVLRISQPKADVYERHGTYISTLRGEWVFVDRRIVQSYVGTGSEVLVLYCILFYCAKQHCQEYGQKMLPGPGKLGPQLTIYIKVTTPRR